MSVLTKLKKNLLILTLMSSFILSPNTYAKTNFLNSEQTEKVLSYIETAWQSLRRSTFDCKSLIDPKTHLAATLYLPADAKVPEGLNSSAKKCSLILKYLPAKIQKLGDVDIQKIQTHGLLYLPNSYIVPGGIFNEMYGWDSYFIILGLLESSKLKMAVNMLENFFYEIENYGGVLNGNRTYYLSRSQPPFLTSMIKAVYTADKQHRFTNLAWLTKAYQYALKDYHLWTSGNHLADNTGLSRYYDFSSGPVPELTDSAGFYYVDITRYFLLHANTFGYKFLEQDGKTSIACYETKHNVVYKCTAIKNWHLNDLFYRSDRAMRESGFDTTFRFGAYNAETINYAPIDLNSLLYKAEIDLEWMGSQLSHSADEAKWHARAENRRKLINKYFWNESKGLYFDYNFASKQQSKYLYATTFYPLWAGLATSQQAQRVVKNLQVFEKQGGLTNSPYQTGVQWDYPYGWAPIQLIAVQGLRNYGYHAEADRISNKFLSMVVENYLNEKTIREKYDVIRRTAKTNIQVGYKENMPGFGWTNGVFLVLLNQLKKN